MRALVTIFGMLLVFGMAFAGLPAESRASQAMLGCPATAQAGQQFTIGVTFDMSPACTMDSQCGSAKACTAGTSKGAPCSVDADCPNGGAGSCGPFCDSTTHTCNTALGAYSIAVTYPAVLTLVDVSGGSTTEFSGRPTANTPTPGTTNLNAFQTASLTSPTGVVSVAMLTFGVDASASGTTAIGLSVTTLFDTNSAPIPVTASGCGVTVTGGVSTTSTTIVTVTTSTSTTSPPSTTTTTRAATTTTSSTTTTTQPPVTTTTTRPPVTTTTTQPSVTTTTTRPPVTTTTTQPPATTTTTRPPVTTTSTTTTTRPPTTITTTTTTRPPSTTQTTTTSSTSSTTGGQVTTTTAPLPTGQCPQGSGFWKNHPELWPVASLTLGSQTYTQAELLALFTTPVKGDASLILARSLIVAKLNIANGSDPTPIADTIADADALLSDFAGKLPYDVRPSSDTGKTMLDDADLLNEYNSGALTPTCDAAASVLIDSPALLLDQLETMAAACSGDGVPSGLQRRLARTRRLLVRARARTGKPAQALLRRAASRLQEAARIAAQAANAGQLSAACSGALDDVLVHPGGRPGS